VHSADEIRHAFPHVAIAVVGGIRFDAMEQMVRTGIADVVSLTRPLLKNPYLVRDGNAVVSDCINCGACTAAATSEGLFCHTNKEKIW
jgi:2,4-dienoyl-CoA reductase-like NADH-dependent reductase (Old Yellow Enzyme family)